MGYLCALLAQLNLFCIGLTEAALREILIFTKLSNLRHVLGGIR